MCKVSFKIDEIILKYDYVTGDWVRHRIQYSNKCHQYLTLS